MAQGSHFDDNVFATEAIRRGYISVAQLEEAKEVQKKLSEIGITEPLSNVMVKRNYMSKQQMDALMAGEKDGGKVTIPGYKVISKIGRGGMGTVYKATQLSIGRPVAIKVLSSRLVQDDPNYVERFTREAKNLATLNHVNIVSAIDAGKVGNVMYYVMEFIEGESLGDILKKRDRLPEQEALHIVMQVTRALEHAQEHEIIHRDIKPDNILITPDGVAKVTDLGLAKSKGEDANLTQTGIAIGTPNYISPEQARGERDLDTRADIYSLGATFYHMVVGEAPFKGSSALEVVTKHLTEQLPSPKTLNPDLSDGLCLVIEKMMAKKRDDRYQGPRELLGDLELVIDGKMPKASKLSVGRSSIMRRVSVGAAAKPLSAEKKAQTARVSTLSKGTHGTATLTISARGKNQWILPVSIAAGVLLLFIIIAVASGGKGTEQPAPAANYQPVRPSKPAVPTPVVTETPKPPAGRPVQEEKPKPVAARPDDRPPSPTPTPREPELNVPSRPTDAASQKVAELTARERSLIDDVNKLREDKNYRNAISAIASLEKVNDEGKQYPSYIVLGDEFRKKVSDEANEDFNKTLLFVEEKLGGDKEALQRMKEEVSKERARFPDDFGKKFDSVAGKIDTAIKEYDKPENLLRRDKYLFETVYNQQIKWLLDMPRLNYPEAREVVKRELIEPNKIRHEEVKKSVEALKKDFEAVAGLIDRLRKVGEIKDDNHHMKISWPEKRKESYENPEPSQSLIMVKINDGEREPASPEVLELIAKTAFKEKPSREMIQAALLLYAYSGCPKDTIVEMMKQQKIDDKTFAKRLDEIATSPLLPCEFGAKLPKPDFLAFAGGGAAADNKPVAAQANNKSPENNPKITYYDRKLFERGRPTTDMKKKIDGLPDDTHKEAVEGAYLLAIIKGSDRKKLLVLSEEKEEIENCELAVVFRNNAAERTRFIFRAEMDGDKIRNGIVFEVKVEGGDKGKIHGKVKLHKFEEGKLKECIDEKQFETRERAVAADDFVFLFFRIQFDPKKKADRVDIFVNLPNVAAASKDEPEVTFVRKDIAGKGITAIELPNLEEYKGETKALMIRDLKLKRLKP